MAIPMQGLFESKRSVIWLFAGLMLVAISGPQSFAEDTEPPSEGATTVEVSTPEAHVFSPVDEPLDTDGPRYEVTKLHLVYDQEHPGLPSLEELANIEVGLLMTESGFVADRDGVSGVMVRLADIDDQVGRLPQYWLYASAIRRVAESVVNHLNQQGLIGVFVGPDPDQIEDGEDDRSDGDTSLRMVIRTVVVTQSRTLASGDRIPAEGRINHALHQRIRAQSPLQPGGEADSRATDLLRRDLLDDYVFRLNRLPGRRVDVAVSRAEESGGVVLDYLVSENKPLLAYFQVSNTGTEQTDEWRQRFGLSLSQLANNDDTLSIDYVTSGFDESHSLVASYEAPLLESERLKWRAFGSWGEYTATDVGAVEDQFKGDNWSYGGEMIANLSSTVNCLSISLWGFDRSKFLSTTRPLCRRPATSCFSLTSVLIWNELSRFRVRLCR